MEEFNASSEEERQVDIRSLFLGAIRLTLETLLEEEIRRIVGAGKWIRTGARKSHRNGSYFRELLTSMGLIELQIPRSRVDGSAGRILGRYKRRTQEIDDAIVEAYVNGVSTRKMENVTGALMGEGVSPSTVSRVTKVLDEKVEELRLSPVPEEMAYLYLDASFLDARWARRVENVSALLAYGVGLEGKRKLLAITIGPRESEESWADLLKQLMNRGLQRVRLVIADDHAGLVAAVKHLLPETPLQRCTVHLERNILDKTPHRLRKRIGRELRGIFQAASFSEARSRMEAFKHDFSKQLPEAVECLESGFKAATQFFAFPKEHWRKIRTTNGVERLHVEVKRRIRVAGAFPDRASALRLITAVLLHVTEIWDDRQYLDVSLLRKEEKKEAA